MAIREILRYPDARLERISEPVGENRSDIADLVADMAETMFATDGAGLAAIQVGVPLRLFIVAAEIAGRDASDPPIVFVDPTIVDLSAEKELADEGCLSFPGIFVPVERALRCRTRARDLNGVEFEIEGEGLFARAMQHENDHLNGRLLANYVGRLKRKMIKRRLEREAELEAAS